jgi:hypothetical protein
VSLDRVCYESKTLYLSGIDLVEGTAVLDVKPVHPADFPPPADLRYPNWLVTERFHPLPVTWSEKALASLTKAMPLEHYDGDLEMVKVAVGTCLAGDPRPEYVRKRNNHDEVCTHARKKTGKSTHFK